MLQISTRTPGHYILSLLLLLASANTPAQDSGWYAGIGAGWADTEMARAGIVSTLQAGGYNPSQFETEDKANAYKIFGGYSFNPNFGIEASYFDPGTFNFNASLLPTAMLGGRASVNGIAFDVVGTWPLQDRFAFFVKAGINSARVEQDFTGAGAGTSFINHSENGVNEKFGAGLQYAFSDTFTLRAELERYRVEDNAVTNDRVDTFTVGIVYRFGSRRPPPPAAMPAARTPVPTPAPASPAPEPPALVTLSASTLFDFDRSVLRTEGVAALDNLVRDMAGLDYEVVIVTGHTDRIGTRDYNLALSQRRADTVRNHLIQAGVPSGRITARGVNSDEPVTTPQQCRGPVSDALKACLQPDRRVVVEVTGTDEIRRNN